MAQLLIFTSGNVFHFGILFENPTFEMKVNNQIKCPKGSKPYLFIENLPEIGVKFKLTDSIGKTNREKGKSGFGELTQQTDAMPCLTAFKTIMEICQEENQKQFTWRQKDMFSKDPAFLITTLETHTNCKRFALRVWKAANLEIPKKFVDDHVAWLKENWFDDEGKPITEHQQEELIKNWQILYKSQAEQIFNAIQGSPIAYE